MKFHPSTKCLKIRKSPRQKKTKLHKNLPLQITPSPKVEYPQKYTYRKNFSLSQKNRKLDKYIPLPKNLKPLSKNLFWLFSRGRMVTSNFRFTLFLEERSSNIVHFLNGKKNFFGVVLGEFDFSTGAFLEGGDFLEFYLGVSLLELGGGVIEAGLTQSADEMNRFFSRGYQTPILLLTRIETHLAYITVITRGLWPRRPDHKRLCIISLHAVAASPTGRELTQRTDSSRHHIPQFPPQRTLKRAMP